LDPDQQLLVSGARVHNLKNIEVSIPRNRLVVLTGLSGSGKSSLAFDTIYAEGQRRYVESFSAYARQFLGNLERPDVDQITGLSPVISIEQKTTSRNPRSTVGTITEVYDFLRLLFARAGQAISYVTGEPMVRYSDEQILNLLLTEYEGRKIVLLAPVVKSRKGHYRELFDQIIKQGYIKARINGTITELRVKMQVDRYKTHNIEVVIDRLPVQADAKGRLQESLKSGLKMGKGSVMILDLETEEIRHFSRHLMCPSSGISYADPAPNLFSFNSPVGSCSRCNGLGTVSEVDLDKIIPNPSLSIRKGGISPLGEYKPTWIFFQLESIGKHLGFDLTTPLSEFSEEALGVVLYGSEEVYKMQTDKSNHHFRSSTFEGIINFLIRQKEELNSRTIDRLVEGFMNQVACPKCLGTRLKKEALYFLIADKNIAQLSAMPLGELRNWLEGLEGRLHGQQAIIAEEILKEIRARVGFLLHVGLDYLTLDRGVQTLSGGEAQRIRLATQIGSQLTGVLYILDEPSIGLHQRDNARLIEALKKLRDLGNSLLVVEHDREMMEAADCIIDIGPGAGIHGGRVVAEGPPEHFFRQNSLTCQYLRYEKEIPVPPYSRKGNGKQLIITGASGHNLKHVSVSFPLSTFICVTGVSGSGKSSLITETLYPILNQHFYRSVKKPLPYVSVEGLNNIDKVIEIDQSPIGRTPRSNPATYTNVFTDIRALFAELPEAKIRGYKPGRFSFNVKGGRCETCQGGGLRGIEMNFLPDVYVLCEDCNGKRYNRETLEIRYHGKSISDVLNMTIEDALILFSNIPSITQKIRTLKDVGLGYVTLGQPSTTLSGGEAQRIKLAAELAKKDTGNTFYILDEPSTGLHFEDIRILLEVLQRLVENGNTVLVIEHNLDIVKVADHVIDLGPEGGHEGGRIVAQGTPSEIASNPESVTGTFLAKELQHSKKPESIPAKVR
jgi:excinuclease ABC subunit A